MFEKLVGNNIEFTVDQQILMITILLTGAAGILTVFHNILTDLPLIIAIANAVLTVSYGVLYYLARILKIFKNISTFFFLIFYVCCSIDWFPNGGIQGSIPYFYITLLGYIICLTKGRKQFFLLLTFVLNISTLFFIEYHLPELVKTYPNRESHFIDMYFCIVLLLFFIAFIVYVLKKLYQQEKKNTIEIIEQYRKNSVSLKEKYIEVINILSIRERDIFEKIIEGRSNKEIASLLYIDEGTVKNHITSIYKKLDVNKRVELINKMNQIAS